MKSYLVVGVIAVGVLLKLLQSAGVISGEAAFGMVVLAMVPVFLGTSILIVRQHLQLRGRVEKLSWERSVALDMRPISDRETLKVAGLALLVLAIAVAVCALGDWERMWRKEPITCVFMGGFGILALIGGGALAWGAMARIHYCRVRKRLLGRRPP